MSRFYAEWEGEGPPPEFWQRAALNAIRGRRGQAFLRELKEALLALPEPRLIEGAVWREGEVCALGALALRRLDQGQPIRCYGHTMTSRAELEEIGPDLEDELGSMELGMGMGMKQTMAWAIAYENDEGNPWPDETPEARYRRVLRWVEGNLAAEAQG
jgi:hypothetical protein